MTINTLTLTNQKIDKLTATLEDIIQLIGPEKSNSITLNNGFSLKPGLNMNDDAATLKKRLTNINQGLFTLLVLGEFNNGKSTLLNAMLGHKLLPASGIPTTAIITVVVQGNRDDVAIYKSNVQEPEYISWADFVKNYRLSPADARRVREGEKLERYKNIEYVQLNSQNPLCANRVRLVDSPGLGEHISRTRLTTKFLKQAQAVMVVLSAMQPLTEHERRFIEEELGPNRLENVFFVINRINQIDQDEVDDIKEWFELGLSNHFCDEDGHFNQAFYQKRVFFVNALAALKARSADPVNHTSLQASQVPALEKALQTFLQSDDKSRATYESTVQLLKRITKVAHNRLNRKKEALNQPVETLIANKKEAEQALKKLHNKQLKLAQHIQTTGEQLYGYLRLSLSEYIRRMQKQWPYEPPEVVDLNPIQAKDFVAALENKNTQKKLERTITEIVNAYLELKFEQWTKTVSEETQAQINRLEDTVKKQVRQVDREIDRIHQQFAFGQANPATLIGLGEETDTRYLADTVVIGGEWKTAASNILGNFTTALKFLGTDAVQLYVIFENLVQSFVSITGKYGQNLVATQNKAYQTKLRTKIGDQIYKALSNDFAHEIFLEGNIKDLPSFAKKLIARQDPLSAYLWRNFSITTLKTLSEWNGQSTQHKQLLTALVNDLNAIIKREECLYTPERFEGIILRDETKRQLEQPTLSGRKLLSLNRWLLTEAYPTEIFEKLQDVLYHNLMYQFNRFAQKTTQPLQKHINEVLTDMETIINELAAEQVLVKAEQERLDTIEQMLKLCMKAVDSE